MAKKRSKPHEKRKAERRILSPDQEWAESLIAKMRAACHPWQLAAVDDTHRRVSMLVGRGGGKTTALRVRGVSKCLRRRKAVVLYFAKTRQRAQDLMWFPLKDLCDNLGLEVGVDVSFNETTLRCTFLRTGSVYQLSGAENINDVEKWRGQTFDEVQIDEGASHSDELLNVLMYRVVGPRMRNGCIVLVGSPGHVLVGTFYDATRPGSDLHRAYSERDIEGEREHGVKAAWSSHWWTLEMVVTAPGTEKYGELVALWENAMLEFEANRWGPDNPIRKREYGAVWARDDTTTIYQYRPRLDDGAPWNEWDPPMVERGPDRVAIAELPLGPDGAPRADWLYALTTDHGAKDPFGLCVFAMSPSDPSRTIYHVYGFEQVGMYARRIAILMLGPRIEKNLEEAHAEPGGIIGALGQWPTGMESDIKQLGQNILDELSQVYGIKFLPADQQGKLAAIELVNSDLTDGRLKILKGSILAKQLLDLQWVKDEYGFPREDKGQANHSTDCLVYGRRLLARLFSSAGDESQSKEKRERVREQRRDPFAAAAEQAALASTTGEYGYLFDTPLDIFKL